MIFAQKDNTVQAFAFVDMSANVANLAQPQKANTTLRKYDKLPLCYTS